MHALLLLLLLKQKLTGSTSGSSEEGISEYSRTLIPFSPSLQRKEEGGTPSGHQ